MIDTTTRPTLKFAILATAGLTCAALVGTFGCSNATPTEEIKYPEIVEVIEEARLPDQIDDISTDSAKFRVVAEWVFEVLPKDGPNGRLRDYAEIDYDIEEMLEDAESGGSFQCNDRATIIARTMVSLGYRGRQVPLRSRQGDGHMLAEAWLPDLEKWITYDPMSEQYFLINGEPASALKLRDYVRAGRHRDVTVSSGPPFSEIAPYFAHARLALTAEERVPNITPTQAVQFRTDDDCLVQFRSEHWYEWPIEQ